MSAREESAKNAFRIYINRFFIHPLSQDCLFPHFDLAIVIPSYGETHLQKTLKSLFSNPVQPGFEVLILVVINHRREDAGEIKKQNAADLEALSRLSAGPAPFHLRVLDARELEDRNAGVGLARKIGMDACVLSLAERGGNPFLVCLDADCEVADHYLQSLRDISQRPEVELATLEFSHLLPERPDEDLARGIVFYEMFLEYYRMGLFRAGYPFFQHTVGSSMACRALPYALSGGMNQRKAAEDFYFLHKLFPHYNSVELPGPLVFPSCRISERVPFGTGRFQQNWKRENKKELKSYHPEIFKGLGFWLRGVENCIEGEADPALFKPFLTWHPGSAAYLEQEKTWIYLHQIRKASPGIPGRRKALYRWFDGLKVLKFVHHFQPFFPEMEIAEALRHIFPESEKAGNPAEKIWMVRNYLWAQGSQ
jgi:hypothetical protein